MKQPHTNKYQSKNKNKSSNQTKHKPDHPGTRNLANNKVLKKSLKDFKFIPPSLSSSNKLHDPKKNNNQNHKNKQINILIINLPSSGIASCSRALI